MTKLQLAGVALVLLLAVFGLIVVAGGILHLYADHMWDDQIRAIQRQQLQGPVPKPPQSPPPAQ